MNPKGLEAGRKKFDFIKKQTLLVFTTALRAPLMLMLNCGYVTKAKSFMNPPFQVHDHGETKMVHIEFDSVPYDELIHGKIFDFIEEGEELPGSSTSTEGQRRIHRHFHTDSALGAHEYSYE